MGRMRPQGAADALLMWQHDCLLHGVPLLSVPGGMAAAQAWRQSPAAEKAWRAHRRELLVEWRQMRADGRVRRDEQPYGSQRFEEGMTDAEYWERREQATRARLGQAAPKADEEIIRNARTTETVQ